MRPNTFLLSPPSPVLEERRKGGYIFSNIGTVAMPPPALLGTGSVHNDQRGRCSAFSGGDVWDTAE